jgi:hypothetical protein
MNMTDKLTAEALGWLKGQITTGIRDRGLQGAMTKARMEDIAQRYNIDLAASVAVRRADMEAVFWDLVTKP